MALYEDPRNEKRHPSRITGNMIKTKLTGVDSSTVFVLDFEHLDAQAILSCGITISSPENALIMRFSNGNIIVPRVRNPFAALSQRIVFAKTMLVADLPPR